MPTPANAINNSIGLLGWTHPIVGGCRRNNSSQYSNCRTEVEGEIKAKGWYWKKDARKKYDVFLLRCVELKNLRSSDASIIRRPQAEETKPAHKALNELTLDCFKKVRESGGKKKRAPVTEELAAEAGTIVD